MNYLEEKIKELTKKSKPYFKWLLKPHNNDSHIDTLSQSGNVVICTDGGTAHVAKMEFIIPNDIIEENSYVPQKIANVFHKEKVDFESGERIRVILDADYLRKAIKDTNCVEISIPKNGYGNDMQVNSLIPIIIARPYEDGKAVALMPMEIVNDDTVNFWHPTLEDFHLESTLEDKTGDL